MEEATLKTKAGPVPVSQMQLDDLEWYANECKSASYRDIAKTELARRKNGGPAPAPVAIVHAPEVQIITGAFRDPRRATDALELATRAGHLVAPAPVCGTLPEGCAIALSAVKVDVANETYSLPGKKQGLGKAALDKIAGAAGVSWDAMLSRRLDDGSDPHYCHYKAVGRVRDFDGTVRVLQGEVEIDARDGSPQIEEIITKARSASPQRDPKGQILELRKFLLRHAESKAKNRAIRSLGLRTSYSAEELQKPFVVAKVQFTGESDDPEIRKMLAGKVADAFLGSQSALYGQGAALSAPTAPAELPAADGKHGPPPVGAVPADDSATEADGEEVPPSRPAPAVEPNGQAQLPTDPEPRKF